MAGFTEEEAKRKTQHPLLPGAIRSLTSLNSAARCVTRIALIRCAYIPISLPMGGPEKIMNTNGAGDGAAALLHDITANNYHRNNVPNSSKHKMQMADLLLAGAGV